MYPLTILMEGLLLRYTMAGGEGGSNSILKCQGGPLPSLPVQTNRSTFADESF